MKARREIILDTVSDAAKDLMIYDRYEDEELLYWDIQNAISAGEITLREIADYFHAKIIEFNKPEWNEGFFGEGDEQRDEAIRDS